MQNNSLETHDIPYEDGALVVKQDGMMYILASNDVRVNMYLLAIQKMLTDNEIVQRMLAGEINKMMHEVATEVHHAKDPTLYRETKSL